MRKIAFMLAIITSFQGVFCQSSDTLKLQDCLKLAGERNPLNRQKEISGEALSNKLRNLNTKWLPAVNLNAQAMVNSETVDFSDILKDMPIDIPSLPLDQYKIWADLNQQVYDGGTIKARKLMERSGYEADIQQTESEMLGVKQQVSRTYFSILIAQKSASLLQVSLDELAERKKVIQAGVAHGVVLPENLLGIEAEEIKICQNLTELKLTNLQLYNILSILIDSLVTTNIPVAEPVDFAEFNATVTRPEYLLFDKQKERLQANKKLISATDMPKVFIFSQGAYGRPGYNMMDRDFHFFYSVGLGMKWDFLHYGESRRQKTLLDLQQRLVDIKRETFEDQLQVQFETERSNIEKYGELIKQDEQLIRLRKEIAATSLSKLSNGIITSTDYLTDLNAEILSRLQYENHKIMRLQATYNYMLLKGIL
jgi:outer membrane protein TolC